MTAREQLERWEMKVVKVHREVEDLRYAWPLLSAVIELDAPELLEALRRRQEIELEWA